MNKNHYKMNILELSKKVRDLKTKDRADFRRYYYLLCAMFKDAAFNKTLTIDQYVAVASIVTDFEYDKLSVKIHGEWFKFKSLELAAAHLMKFRLSFEQDN